MYRNQRLQWGTGISERYIHCKWLSNKYCRQDLSEKHSPEGKENTQKTPIDFEKSFKVPYVKGFSDILRRELQKEGIHVIFSKGTTLEKKLCKLTPKKPIEESKHNIYRKYCSKCSATYIGESGMTMKQRDTPHNYFLKIGHKNRKIKVCLIYSHKR